MNEPGIFLRRNDDKQTKRHPITLKDGLNVCSQVETINDAYMVASGVPKRNGDAHAKEIANLALALMVITPTIEVPHKFVSLFFLLS